MDRDGYWALVEAAGEAARWDAEGVADDLVCRLRELPVAELVGFDAVQRDLLAESYRWDLWGAAYVLDGGRSDACFESFRAWLIAQGRAVWEAARRDPDSLAGHPAVRDRQAGDEHQFDGKDLLAVAERAYEHATAGEAVRPLGDLLDEGRGPDAAVPPIAAGEPFDFDDPDELRRRYPRLMALMDG